jgi:hypothetical protein
MTIDRRLLAGALGCMLLVAACGSSSASPSPAASTAASTAPSAAAGSSGAAGASSSDQGPTAAPTDGGPEASFTAGAAAELERLLPSTLGTLTFTKTSFNGSQVANAGSMFDTSKLDPVLAKYHKSVADVRMAIAQATPSAASPTDFAIAIAVQLLGVPASQFATDMDATAISPADKQNVGGKDVYLKTESGITTIYYLKDDITFMISGSTANATAILATLP